MMIEIAFALTALLAALSSSAEQERSTRFARRAVMGDRALELGFEPPPGMTPSWDLDIEHVRYNVTPHWLYKDVWERELRLWACDCAERAVFLCDEISETLGDRPRKTIEIARRFARGNARAIEMSTAATFLDAVIQEADRKALTPYARAAARAARSTAFMESGSPVDVARIARFALHKAGRTPEEVEAEWQYMALAERIDRVSPWRLE